MMMMMRTMMIMMRCVFLIPKDLKHNQHQGQGGEAMKYDADDDNNDDDDDDDDDDDNDGDNDDDDVDNDDDYHVFFHPKGSQTQTAPGGWEGGGVEGNKLL